MAEQPDKCERDTAAWEALQLWRHPRSRWMEYEEFMAQRLGQWRDDTVAESGGNQASRPNRQDLYRLAARNVTVGAVMEAFRHGDFDSLEQALIVLLETLVRQTDTLTEQISRDYWRRDVLVLPPPRT